MLSFKDIIKTLPENCHEAFSIFWLQTEKILNDKFAVKQHKFAWGDQIYIGQYMPSRTLILKHKFK